MLKELTFKKSVVKLGVAIALMPGVCAYAAAESQSRLIDFSDLSLIEDETFWNGEDGSGGFTSGGIYFPNAYTDWGDGFYSWEGFSYSNQTDTVTPGHANQYSAFTGGGFDGNGVASGATYVVAYGAETLLSAPDGNRLDPDTIWVTNTTYVALSIRDGDDFAKKFGGVDGTDPDTFVLTIEGIDPFGAARGSVAVYLADFRDGGSFIAEDWLSVDLSSLGPGIASLRFNLASTDVGEWGMNTPASFAIGRFETDLLAAAFPDAVLAGDGRAWYRDGFGTYDDTFMPWIWHSFLGWVYWNPEQPTAGRVVWSPHVGWLHFAVETNGYLFSYGKSRWFFYVDLGRSGGWIYDFDSGNWEDTPAALE